jgi:hypothetical protein
MDDQRKPVPDADEEQPAQPSRRAVVAGIAAALAATAAKLAPEEAKAQDGDALILGTINTATTPTVLTRLPVPGDESPAVVIEQPLAAGPALLVSAPAGIGLHVPSDTGTPIIATAGPMSSVSGATATATPLLSTGVAAFADFGVGVKGVSGLAIHAAAVTQSIESGLAGFSDANVGAIGIAGLDAAATPPVTFTGILGASERGVIGIGGGLVDISAATVTAFGRTGVMGIGGDGSVAGVIGLSETGGGVIGIGGDFATPSGATFSSRLFGVAGLGAEGSDGVLGLSVSGSDLSIPVTISQFSAGAGLRGISTDPAGVGVVAENPGGVALRVIGRLQLQTAGEDVIPAGQTGPLLVPNAAVTGQSHVTVTFTVLPLPKGLRVLYVERMPGIGFAVHLKGRPRIAVPFTWSVVEPNS